MLAFCHHCPCEKSLLCGPQEHLSPEGHLCMGLLAARSPSGDIFMGTEILALNVDCYQLFHISQRNMKQKFQTGHYSMSIATLRNL